MATIEYWIQIENRFWDISPGGIDGMLFGESFDRMDGVKVAAATVPRTITSPETHVTQLNRPMWKPLLEEALILRRYTKNWAKPDDRKVNPWDLNEFDPTDNGTMGTIPGAVIECSVGDSVVVHFRNRDERKLDVRSRTHSLHPHGFVFAPTSDGAFPLSPADPTQPVGAEAPIWAQLPPNIRVGNFKQGDRVPPPILGSNQPGGTFTYTWNTFGWPTTAGVWLYHDHSICDMPSVDIGAIGIIVIHNAKDPADVVIGPADLPFGSPVGNPVSVYCFPFPFEVRVQPGDLQALGMAASLQAPEMPPMAAMPKPATARKKSSPAIQRRAKADLESTPVWERLVDRGEFLFELDPKFEFIRRFCFRNYIAPPAHAQYLLLFHDLTAVGMCINGRQFLGSTPTVIAGRSTKMRFGVVGMGDFFHTFHLHGHRWVIPGPDGNTPAAIQSSPQIKAVSQFEDTRAFGPANSFSFAIDEGSGFMRADPFTPGSPLGEWHMHCHVLGHMQGGMMGSLLIVDPNQVFSRLPRGEPCPAPGTPPPPGAHEIDAVLDNTNPSGLAWSPASINVLAGDTVFWKDTVGAPHSILWDSPMSPPNVAQWPANTTSASVLMPMAGTFNYHCGVHGTFMKGTITVT